MRERLVLPGGAPEERHDSLVVVDPEPEARSRIGVEALDRELVLLRWETHAVGVALPVDLGRPPVPLDAPDGRPVVDELVVVELRPAEPGPPLRPRLALVVVDEVSEQPSRRALLRAREERRLERRPLRVALLRLRRSRTQLGRVAPRDVVRPQAEQPLVQSDRGAAVLLVVALDLVEDRGLPGLHPL